jgi:hypothetical protein
MNVIGEFGALKVAKSFRKLVFLPFSFKYVVAMQWRLPDLHARAREEHAWVPFKFVMPLNKERLLHGYRASLKG